MAEPLRVALHVDGRTIRGSERQLLHAAGQLRAYGHEVHVSCVPGTPVADAFRALGAHVTGARPRGDIDPASLLGYVRWLRRVRPQVMLLTSWKRAAVSALGARLARVPRIVLRVGLAHSPRGGAGDRLRRHALRHWIDALWVNAGELGAHVVGYAGGAPRGGVHVIPNVVAAAAPSGAALRAAISARPEERVLFSAGGLEKRKGYEVLLGALAKLPPSVRLAIAGDGPDRRALETLAARLGIGDRVHLLGQRADIAALLADADAFALATRGDSTPNAALEAMAAGVPVVITAVPGSDALLEPDTAAPLGWVVPVDDAPALAAAIRAALGPEGSARAARARERVQRERAPEVLGARLEHLLRDLFSAGPRPPRPPSRRGDGWRAP